MRAKDVLPMVMFAFIGSLALHNLIKGQPDLLAEYLIVLSCVLGIGSEIDERLYKRKPETYRRPR